MPEYQRSPGADVVDVAILVEIVEIGPLTAIDEDRLTADGSERAGRRRTDRRINELRRESAAEIDALAARRGEGVAV